MKLDVRAIEAIYAEIPDMIGCDGGCAESCGPIAMFSGEWQRVKRSFGSEPRMRRGQITCPMLSPTGKCMVYSVRPYICRLWGTTRALACPRGCKPERWLSRAEAQDIFIRLQALAGPGVDGPLGNVDDLWEGIALAAREDRETVIQAARDHQAMVRRVQEELRGPSTT